jgi:hypothetical protein
MWRINVILEYREDSGSQTAAHFRIDAFVFTLNSFLNAYRDVDG